MTKVKVFIDFEAISLTFSKIVELGNNFPFAYSMGIYVGKKFKVRTFIFNFLKHSTESVYEILKYQIFRDIRIILNQRNFKINPQSIEFIGWNPILEQKIIEQALPNFTVKALNQNFELSLTRLTPEIKNDYFTYVRKSLQETSKLKNFLKRAFERDGALAGYIGFILYAFVHLPDHQYLINCDHEIMLKELRQYSRDDVKRMAFLYNRPQLLKERKIKAITLVKLKQKLKTKINKKERILKIISEFEQDQTIGQIILTLNQELVELKKEKAIAEKQFENI